MKRVGNLWTRIVSLQNLLLAAHVAARNKRKRPDVARFFLDLEPEVVRLRRELMDGSYVPGEYRTFAVRDPKPRLISAAPFRDRVVHHALTRVIEPIFERRFSPASFACRRGFGTHRAIRNARQGCAKFPFVLKCDIMKYFPSIDHQILNTLLGRVIKCRPTLQLAATIIEKSNPQEAPVYYFPNDNLFTPFERRRGLPLGNQTSQFFANVYLNPLDHFITRELRPGRYIRYVDDFLLFDLEKARLNEMRHAIEDFLAGYRVRIHPGKSRVYPAAHGVTFLGWRIFPGRLRLDRRNVARFRRRIADLHRLFCEGRIGRDEVKRRIQAWIAHASHGDTWRLREMLLSRYNFTRGCAV